MSDEAKESPSPNSLKEFQVGRVKAAQKGRVTRLEYTEFGTTYLIEVTDREDPTAGKTVQELMEKITANATFDNNYASNNGVVVLITDQLDKDRRKRIYVGVEMINSDDEKGIEITSHILESAGFKQNFFYVPMSFNSINVRQNISREIAEATKGSQSTTLFGDATKLLE